MSEADNLATFRRYVDEVFNAGNLAVVDEIFAPDYHSHHNDPVALPPGPEGVKQFVAATRDGFPDLTMTLDDSFGSGDMIASRWTLRGTNSNTWFGNPATDKFADWAGVVISRFENGKIAEEWFNFDQLRLLQMLGIIPSQ